MSTTPWLAFSRRHSKQPIAEAFSEAQALYRARRHKGPTRLRIHEDDAQCLAPLPRSLAVTLTTDHPGTFLMSDGDQP